MNILKKFNVAMGIRALCCGLVLAAAMSVVCFEHTCDGIRNNVLRLHIKANSDSQEDQELKLFVRDAVLNVSEEIFSSATTEEEAFSIAKENIDLLNETAQNAVFQKGYDYDVSVTIGDAWFETRRYEHFTLPAGTYEAVRINIGSGEGKNWWCVMFPALCIPSAKADDVSDNFEEREEKIVTQSEKYVVRFKTVEIFERIKNKIGKIFGN